MRTQITGLGVAAAILAAATAANAQTAAPPAPELKTYASSSDVTALIAKAKADLKPGRPMSAEAIVVVPPYRASLEYRVAPAPPVAHLKDAELLYVVDGGGTFVMGGKMVDEKPGGANSSGTSIDGGTTLHLAKGDFVFVPENTPHWFKAIDGDALIDMSIHMPRPVPGGQ